MRVKTKGVMAVKEKFSQASQVGILTPLKNVMLTKEKSRYADRNAIATSGIE
jgi:hypothetical protein